MNLLLMGAIAMASAVAALFFLKFWKKTGDRFFFLFSAAFVIDALSRIVLAMSSPSEEQEPLFYLARLLSFGIILIAIIDKNYSKKR
ncbi:MAG: DUF5985 family protein [Pseudomonadota bacterium]